MAAEMMPEATAQVTADVANETPNEKGIHQWLSQDEFPDNLKK